MHAYRHYYLLYPFAATSIQIHYTGRAHWVTSSYIGGKLRLYDSFVSTTLARSLKAQMKKIYVVASKDSHIRIAEMPVQQQSNLTDCGIYSIAFAYHLAIGDEPSALNFDDSKLRQHLVQCFEAEELSPFPVLYGQSDIRHCAKKYRTIHV